MLWHFKGDDKQSFFFSVELRMTMYSTPIDMLQSNTIIYSFLFSDSQIYKLEG